jgi:hypothetical protein
VLVVGRMEVVRGMEEDQRSSVHSGCRDGTSSRAPTRNLARHHGSLGTAVYIYLECSTAFVSLAYHTTD